MENKNIKNAKILGRIFFKGTLKNKSAMAISDGQTDYSDADIHKNKGGKPIIPSTALIGVIKSKLENQKMHIDEKELFNFTFGFTSKDGYNDVQAHLIIDDVVCNEVEINTMVRDGVKIEHDTNLAVYKGKYDYELLESGHEFGISGEITVREAYENLDITSVLSKIKSMMEGDDLLQVGALTSFGFGQLELTSLDSTTLLTGSDYFEFLENQEDKKFWQPIASLTTDNEKPFSQISMKLIPTTPLFIGGGQAVAPDADDASLKSREGYILSAKSMKGAVRHHAFRIANTVHEEDNGKILCNSIFGNRDEKELTKSLFWTEDSKIEHPDRIESQAQVAIDRFTGGAIETALFATEPVWPTSETYTNITWRLKTTKDESLDNASIGLLLLVARDLMNEMLPIGGSKAIGRGRFKGDNFVLKIQDKTLTTKDVSSLDGYINSFLNFKPNQDVKKNI